VPAIRVARSGDSGGTFWRFSFSRPGDDLWVARSGAFRRFVDGTCRRLGRLGTVGRLVRLGRCGRVGRFGRFGGWDVPAQILPRRSRPASQSRFWPHRLTYFCPSRPGDHSWVAHSGALHVPARYSWVARSGDSWVARSGDSWVARSGDSRTWALRQPATSRLAQNGRKFGLAARVRPANRDFGPIVSPTFVPRVDSRHQKVPPDSRHQKVPPTFCLPSPTPICSN
jgi:hypothetical protein